MPRTRQSNPTSRGSFLGAVLGIAVIAGAVLVAVPVAMNWPASWPGAVVVVAMGCIGVALIAAHISRHRWGRTRAKGARDGL